MTDDARREKYLRDVDAKVEEIVVPVLEAFYAARDGRRGIVSVRFEALLRVKVRLLAIAWVDLSDECAGLALERDL